MRYVGCNTRDLKGKERTVSSESEGAVTTEEGSRKGRQEHINQKKMRSWNKGPERDNVTDFEDGGRGVRRKGMWGVSTTWEKEIDSPLEPPERKAGLQHLAFTPVSSKSDFWIIELQANTFALF